MLRPNPPFTAPVKAWAALKLTDLVVGAARQLPFAEPQCVPACVWAFLIGSFQPVRLGGA